jgi:hypothetical protein
MRARLRWIYSAGSAPSRPENTGVTTRESRVPSHVDRPLLGSPATPNASQCDSCTRQVTSRRPRPSGTAPANRRGGQLLNRCGVVRNRARVLLRVRDLIPRYHARRCGQTASLAFVGSPQGGHARLAPRCRLRASRACAEFGDATTGSSLRSAAVSGPRRRTRRGVPAALGRQARAAEGERRIALTAG